MVNNYTFTINHGVALSCMGSRSKFPGQTSGFLICYIIPSDPWAARRLPCEGDAVGVQGCEANVCGWDNYRLGWKRKQIHCRVKKKNTIKKQKLDTNSYWLMLSNEWHCTIAFTCGGGECQRGTASISFQCVNIDLVICAWLKAWNVETNTVTGDVHVVAHQ